jgi:hypothetical protein
MTATEAWEKTIMLSKTGFSSNAASTKRAPHCKEESEYLIQRIKHSVVLLPVGIGCMYADMSTLTEFTKWVT